MKQSYLQDYIEFSKERFTKRILFKEGESTVFVLNFAPTQALPKHKHPGTNVYLLVLDGEGTFTIDGKDVKAKKHDVIVCHGDEELAFVNDGEQQTSLYVMLSKIPDERYAQDI
ncbi:cupin domain-containing protein [Bacillus sp. 2205SS5-2]|uniref:cupin domain-containing protein n=1 Tax=Bacillus sp. 2205SS5-2 TaxID=3109031 RepID=UPI0030052461